MLKRLLILLFFVTISVTAQDTISIKINPVGQFKKVMIYSITGANQKYIANASLIDDKFQLVIPKGSSTGMYRLYFGANKGYFDFVYNHEPVSVTFDADSPEQTAVFEISEENKIYQEYLNSIEKEQYKLDSLQYAYFGDTKNLELTKKYEVTLKKVNDLQDSFEKQAEDKFVYSYIKADEKYYSPKIIATPKEYLKTIETHFYDFIDFSDAQLMQSSFFVDRVIEYVFYMATSEDTAIDIKVKKKAIRFSMDQIGENYKVKSEVLSSLMYAFAGQENIKMTRFVRNQFYLKLPEKYISKTFISQINKMLKLAIGAVAPEITWQENGDTKKLSELDTAQRYLLVFWSTTCPHCVIEIPELHGFTKKIDGLKVIGVALEENDKGFNEDIKRLPDWTNVLALGKWDNKYVDKYDIVATPTYFILDADKKIIAKPETLEDVKQFFRGY